MDIGNRPFCVGSAVHGLGSCTCCCGMACSLPLALLDVGNEAADVDSGRLLFGTCGGILARRDSPLGTLEWRADEGAVKRPDDREDEEGEPDDLIRED